MTVPVSFDERFVAPRLSFSLEASSDHEKFGPRAGRLTFQWPDSKREIDTPGLVAYSSKGALPHITPDNVARLPTEMVHVSLEHLLETHPPSFAEAPFSLHRFLGLHAAIERHGRNQRMLFMSLQDPSAVSQAKQGTDSTLACKTARGSFQVATSAFEAWSLARPPDVLIAMADETIGAQAGKKRLQRCVIRSVEWLQSLLKSSKGRTNVFAPLVGGASHVHRRAQARALLGHDSPEMYMPSPTGREEETLDSLMSGYSLGLPIDSGLDVASLFQSSLEQLDHTKARLVPSVRGPHDILRLVGQVGIDLFVDEWSSNAASMGVLLNFTFGSMHNDAQGKRDVGLNMYDERFARDFSPLLESDSQVGSGLSTLFGEGSIPSKAYVHHMLESHEMSALVVLAMTNQLVMQHFMSSVRASIRRGTFERDARSFFERYEDAVSGPAFGHDREYECVLEAGKGHARVDKARGKGSLKQPDKPTKRKGLEEPAREIQEEQGTEVMSLENGRDPLVQ